MNLSTLLLKPQVAVLAFLFAATKTHAQGISGSSQVQVPANVSKGLDWIWALLTGKWALVIILGIVFAAAFQVRSGKMTLDSIRDNIGSLALFLLGPAIVLWVWESFR
jgi:type IV secretory pathway VirB2 component (pilin)